MNLGKKIISVAAAAALVAGAGAMAATPAAAKKKPQIKGTTVLEVPLALVGAAAGAGVALAPVPPSKAQATDTVVGVTFPVSGPLVDGAVNHRGGISLASSNTGITLTATKPSIEYATSGGKTATLTVEINGIPDSSPFAGLNGQRVPFLTVSNFKISGKWGKAKKSGKSWKQTYTGTVRGNAALVDNDTVIGALNGFMGVEIFVAGLDFGKLSSKYTVTNTCKTKKQCSNR